LQEGGEGGSTEGERVEREGLHDERKEGRGLHGEREE
jgi:hypothetical protein